MVILNPSSVMLGGAALAGVESIAVNRTADKVVVEHSDLGPCVALVDVPERRVTIVLRRRVDQDEPPPARPGDSVALTFRSGESVAAASMRQYTANVVVTAVEHRIESARAVSQTITMIAWSTDGASEPVSESVLAG